MERLLCMAKRQHQLLLEIRHWDIRSEALPRDLFPRVDGLIGEFEQMKETYEKRVEEQSH